MGPGKGWVLPAFISQDILPGGGQAPHLLHTPALGTEGGRAQGWDHIACCHQRDVVIAMGGDLCSLSLVSMGLRGEEWSFLNQMLVLLLPPL